MLEILKFRGIWNHYMSVRRSGRYWLVDSKLRALGDKIKYNLGLDWPFLTPQQSKYTVDLYDETIRLNATYYQQCTI
jgi:hypothetical protein